MQSHDNGEVTVYLFRALDTHLIRFLCSLLLSVRVKVDVCLFESSRAEPSQVDVCGDVWDRGSRDMADYKNQNNVRTIATMQSVHVH